MQLLASTGQSSSWNLSWTLNWSLQLLKFLNVLLSRSSLSHKRAKVSIKVISIRGSPYRLLWMPSTLSITRLVAPIRSCTSPRFWAFLVPSEHQKATAPACPFEMQIKSEKWINLSVFFGMNPMRMIVFTLVGCKVCKSFRSFDFKLSKSFASMKFMDELGEFNEHQGTFIARMMKGLIDDG